MKMDWFLFTGAHIKILRQFGYGGLTYNTGKMITRRSEWINKMNEPLMIHVLQEIKSF